MLPVSFREVSRRSPQLVADVMARLDGVKHGVSPGEISWFLVECHDDPEQPLDEAACADVMLTGRLPCRRGVCGILGAHYRCACGLGSIPCGVSAVTPH